MKKQIIYTNFVPRIFSVIIDLSIMSIIFSPIMSYISKHTFSFVFYNKFIEQGVDINNTDTTSLQDVMSAFAKLVTLYDFMIYTIIIFILNFMLIGIYFVFFWNKYGATPGKFIMRMKIVDADTYSKPSAIQLIKRFTSYLFSSFVIWSMIFNKRRLTVHDKIANTVVIKT